MEQGISSHIDGSPVWSHTLQDVLVERRQPALRVSDSHYLVQWRGDAAMWCVVNMAALDEHADNCATFRFRQCCEHLERIAELCAREAAGLDRCGAISDPG